MQLLFKRLWIKKQPRSYVILSVTAHRVDYFDTSLRVLGMNQRNVIFLCATGYKVHFTPSNLLFIQSKETAKITDRFFTHDLGTLPFFILCA